MVDGNGSRGAPGREEIGAALDAATRLRQDTLSFMRAAEKIDNIFIRNNEGKPEGYAGTPYGQALVGARDSVDRLTIVILSLTRLQRDHVTISASDFSELEREIDCARIRLSGLGPPPECDEAELDDDED